MSFLELDLDNLNAALGDLPLGGIRYYPQVGSTNDLAISWAGEGAADVSLLIADEQTSGRGRNGRKWYSPAGASLAFSLVLKPDQEEARWVGLFTALAALAVVQAIKALPGNLVPKIKWPNDVLVSDRKVCGILTETTWVGEGLASLVIGVGINVTAGSVPSVEFLNYPATSLEEVSCSRIDRVKLLHAILEGIFYWRSQLGKQSFMDAWESSLAFLGDQVKIWTENEPDIQGIIQGLDKDGGLIIKDNRGKLFSVHNGELHLVPQGL